MAYTKEVQKRIDFLRSSVRLQSPDTETDPAYKFDDEDLYAILSVVTPTHNPNYTIETLPDTEFNFVNLLGKKEIYYRLATSTAPFYPLSAEGAELQKNVRFDHYMKLLEQTEKDYKNAVELSKSNQFGIVETYEQLAQGKHYTTRNYNLMNAPTVSFKVDNIRSNSLDISWTKFGRGLFDKYLVYAEETPILDEYADDPIPKDLVAKFFSVNIHRLKCRVEDLKPDTEYYVCVVSADRTGLAGFEQQQIRTLPQI